MSFYGAPKPAKPPIPPYGSKLPRERRHSTKLYFNEHSDAVAFCKTQARHLDIITSTKLVDDKLVKVFIVDFEQPTADARNGPDSGEPPH